LEVKNRNIQVPSLFITSSQYAFQLPSKVKDLIMLFKKKTNTEGIDESYIEVEENNTLVFYFDYFISEIKFKTRYNVSGYKATLTILSIERG